VQLSEESLKVINTASIEDALLALTKEAPGQVVFSTSFSWEDQLISHFIFSNNIPIDVFTLDTGRMFPETYSTWSATLDRYKKPITAYYPNAQALQEYIVEKGPNGFYESVENRKQCCGIRKVEPLKRALAGRKIWVTGIRAEHSANRDHMPQVEWDEKAILCGVCRTEQPIQTYLRVRSCPDCGARFNPGCKAHRHLYFVTEDCTNAPRI